MSCVARRRDEIDKDLLRAIVAERAAGPDHPIKTPILHAAVDLIDGKALPWREGVELMKRVADYDGQRAALAIAYFASDCDDPEGDAALTRTEAEIRQQWDAKDV